MAATSNLKQDKPMLIGTPKTSAEHTLLRDQFRITLSSAMKTLAKQEF